MVIAYLFIHAQYKMSSTVHVGPGWFRNREKIVQKVMLPTSILPSSKSEKIYPGSSSLRHQLTSSHISNAEDIRQPKTIRKEATALLLLPERFL